MKIFLVRICLLWIIAGAGLLSAQDNLRYFGRLHLEYSWNRSELIDYQNNESFFDNWSEANLQYKYFRIGARFEMHNAPQTFAFDQTIRRGDLPFRYAEYDRGNLNLRVGNFYELLGRGLVLRLFENRQLRYNTMGDGVRFVYLNPLFNVKLMAGQSINRVQERQSAFQAGEVKLKPFKFAQVGGTFLTTDPADKDRVSWGSIFSDVNFKYGSFYLEYAREDNPNKRKKGDALYLNSNLFLGPFSLLMEYKDFDQFKQFEGTLYNNPPLVAREHLFTLLNRHQLIQNADDERGFMLEASYPVIEDGVLLFNYSRTENHNKALLYQEYYGQFDWLTNGDWEVLSAFGRQEDAAARYLNFVQSLVFQINDTYALKGSYEHQHARRKLNNQQFYSQALSLGFSHAPGWTISFLGERTTEQESEQEFWAAGQLELTFFQKTDLSLFVGARREGKICIGGVCVNKPALEGVEITLITRF